VRWGARWGAILKGMSETPALEKYEALTTIVGITAAKKTMEG
jgi:hypothetical protein